jgi:hypothetical protein
LTGWLAQAILKLVTDDGPDAFALRRTSKAPHNLDV